MDIPIKGSVSYGDILKALGLDEIEGIDHHDEHEISFDDVSVSSDDAMEELSDRGLLPEPDEDRAPAPRDLREALAELAAGNIGVSRVLFHRFFEDAFPDHDKLNLCVEEALRNWPKA